MRQTSRLTTASKAGITPTHAPKLRRQLAQLDGRLTFRFEDGDAVLVDYRDHHWQGGHFANPPLL